MDLKNAIKKGLKLFLGKRPVYVTANIERFDWSKTLAGRAALITGGTSGIGFAIAKSFAEAGATVVITGRSKEKIDNAVEALRKAGFDAFGCQMDNGEVMSFDKKLSEMLKLIKGRNLDILVNNAGVNYCGLPNATEEEYDKVMDTNLKGAFFLSQVFGKYLVSNGIHGNILNIASSSSIRPADSAYCLSKWGLRGLTLGLAKSLAKYHVTVNSIAPGPTATPMMKRSSEGDISLERIPLGRYILPEEIANMAVILVSDMGRSILGDTIFMTGGAGLLTYDDVPYSF